MCASSRATLRGIEVDLGMGYGGGTFTIWAEPDQLIYEKAQTSLDDPDEDRERMKEFLMKHQKEEIIDMLLTLVENGEES